MRLRILRQVRFDTVKTDTIDVVLTANGIPVVTMELKTENTQTVHHAIRQYKEDRKPGKNRPLLAPGRALVHFAVSNDEVYMTSKLDGTSTKFLPFNRGHEGRGGNPPTGGSPTNYLWREILARPMFMRILKDFAFWDPGKNPNTDGKLIFPRYHQLRAVERVVADIEQHDPNAGGGRYLIWHSAGSGKTKTIAWLSHRLIRHMDASQKSTFDSVIVVTDRQVLDENIRADMNLLQASKGLVVNVTERGGTKSSQLKKALDEGDHIITCTLQTFPELMKAIEDTSSLRGRRWAVIVDEAHSSQSGETARSLKELLTDVEIDSDEELSSDDLLLAQDSAIAQAANITFVALTATPKSKTLRLFGREAEDGSWEAFDTYTMAQAIEEGFILDVLSNYSTYDMFLQVKNHMEGEDTLVNTDDAVTNIVRFARLHPTNIAQKVRVVVEHFHRNVAHLLGGKAKAMVVTDSRLEARLWSQRMNEYIAEKGYHNFRTLVAYSGWLEDETGEKVTEAGINQRSDTAHAFKTEDEFRVLIVANKFQTGFDEPRLMAMYVDKKLSGIATVQTLSRLNRVYPGKTAPMVLDFRNSPASIQEDFKKYYSDARVIDDVDPNSLYDIADRLDTAGIYDADEMQEVSEAYLSDAGGEAISKAITPIKQKWTGLWRQAALKKDKATKDQLEAFRSDVIKYRNAWQFLSQIVDFADPELRRRALLTSLLARHLHLSEGETEDDDYLAGVQLAEVAYIPDQVEQDYSLTSGADGTMEPPAFGGMPKSGRSAPARGPLEEVIDRVNQLFAANGADVGNTSVRGFITAYWEYLNEDADAAAMAKNNSVDQLKASDKFRTASELAAFKACQDATEIQSFMADPSFMTEIANLSAEQMHEQLRRGQQDGSGEE